MSIVAVDEHGRLVSIRDVPRGLACNCICPGCDRRMVARTKDDKRAAHFAHHGVAGLTCTSAGETALHKFAKEVVDQHLEFMLPPRKVTEAGEEEVVVPAGIRKFDKAILERKTGAVIPDVLLVKRGRPLIVEFKVTHACGPEKIAEIKRLNIGAIEINLSPFRHMKLGELADIILFKAERSWLHNPLDGEARQRARKRAHDRAKAIDKAASDVVSKYQHRRPAKVPGSGKAEKAIRGDGLDDYIDTEVRGSGCFTVPLAQWQAAVLQMFLGAGYPEFGLAETYFMTEDQGWVDAYFRELSREVIDVARRKAADFQIAIYAVREYLKFLDASGVLTATGDGDGWRASPGLRKVVEKARELRERPAKRFDDLESCVLDALKDLPPGETEAFDIRAWADQIMPGRDFSPKKALHLDDMPWRSFRGDLVNLRWQIQSRPEPDMDLMGLPLTGELHRQMERKALERAARELAKAQKEQAAADSRVGRLKSEAWQGLGGEADGWFNAPHRDLGGRIPREVAAISDDDYVGVNRLLSQRIREFELARAQEQKKGAAFDDVVSFARTKLGEVKAGLWIRGYHPRLQARPEDYIIDETTRDVCLKLIDPKVDLAGFRRKRA
ncbi:MULTISPECIES: hypothetical protein [unclassified Bosea (in: a-proteobacteria)]|uniref:hypothetical protein n=1 Tax=unclassified Bosea (in: a-proteobacteria) TaxID=2653178 RepID=UPI00125F1B4A|nr:MULTISPECIES: hypothetical protein [unclassified Bosea (in: a-proteobacteria)]